MAGVTRRQFLLGACTAAACGLGAAAGLSGNRWWEWTPQAPPTKPVDVPPSQWSVEARYYASFSAEGSLNCVDCHSAHDEPLELSYCHTPHTGAYVRCNLCPRRCIIAEGERGECQVRMNQGGRLFSLVYGNPCAVHLDPIEKKPFFHFLPTAGAFSIATAGCNLHCMYCQNWSISQLPPEETRNVDLPPHSVVQSALQSQAPVIAYTYSEPTVFFEYMLDTAKAARDAGLLNVVISAGYINREPLEELCRYVDAIKIDLKGFDPGFYRDVCDGELDDVIQTIQTVFQAGVHLELVNLVVPTLNDDLQQLRNLAGWIARELSPDIPLHFSRFHPQYKLANLPPTPVETLDRAYQAAQEEGVRFVYVGNVPGHPANNTYCPSCGKAVIVREGFVVAEYRLEGGACPDCGKILPGVWWPDQPQGMPVEVPAGPRDQ